MSVPFEAGLLADTLASQSFLDSPLLARFQVEGVPLNFLDNILLLNLALKAPQRVLQRLAFLKSHFSQLLTHPISLFDEHNYPFKTARILPDAIDGCQELSRNHMVPGLSTT